MPIAYIKIGEDVPGAIRSRSRSGYVPVRPGGEGKPLGFMPFRNGSCGSMGAIVKLRIFVDGHYRTFRG